MSHILFARLGVEVIVSLESVIFMESWISMEMSGMVANGRRNLWCDSRDPISPLPTDGGIVHMIARHL